MEGGRPERFDATMTDIQEGSLFISFRLFFIFEILIVVMVRVTEIQYSVTKIAVIFRFDKIAVSIHLRLKIEERAMNSMIFFLFSCDRDPVASLMTIPIIINPFEMKMVRYKGASFCHVIRIVAFFRLVLLVMSINQEWKGDLASLVSSASAPLDRKIFWIVLVSCVDMEVTNIADATDWIIKYLSGESSELFWEFGSSIIDTNDSVFISSAVQITSHEFLVRQTKDEITRDEAIRMNILMLSFKKPVSDSLRLEGVLALARGFGCFSQVGVRFRIYCFLQCCFFLILCWFWLELCWGLLFLR